ncbi:hypothetical protein GWN26_00565 [Candidatus Saccharibacteria bacterium]|nr:hypothetical protein [Candidatus Saccharibacteria bacterium]NIS37670.1 hypothetical protein [Candidatus Saccharibacteria bacterium]NIV73122.1 hypothetical protein [Calditrichia bacterium]NIV97712.1 hypothetical protein [Candidatus Saccharibacteria bacterium]NIW79420.1 hypothetical protein [Calditrichia bacterium]
MPRQVALVLLDIDCSEEEWKERLEGEVSGTKGFEVVFARSWDEFQRLHEELYPRVSIFENFRGVLEQRLL